MGNVLEKLGLTFGFPEAKFNYLLFALLGFLCLPNIHKILNKKHRMLTFILQLRTVMSPGQTLPDLSQIL